MQLSLTSRHTASHLVAVVGDVGDKVGHVMRDLRGGPAGQRHHAVTARGASIERHVLQIELQKSETVTPDVMVMLWGSKEFARGTFARRAFTTLRRRLTVDNL